MTLNFVVFIAKNLPYGFLTEYQSFSFFSTKDKALPFIASLVKRAADESFKGRFSKIRDGPLIQELPVKSGNSKLNNSFKKCLHIRSKIERLLQPTVLLDG